MTTRIRGTLLQPGVSANGRYYSPAMIKQAVQQAQERVRAGRFVLKSHHDAPDTLGTVGRITSLQVSEDGSAQFEGEMATTSTARDVAALIRGKQPFVSGVSLEGRWTGKTRRVTVDGQAAETADGLKLTACAVTGEPGVHGARIVAESASGKGKRRIYESAVTVEPVEPVRPERTAREYAAMTNEEFAVAAYEDRWKDHFAAADERRRANPSPGLPRGLTR